VTLGSQLAFVLYGFAAFAAAVVVRQALERRAQRKEREELNRRRPYVHLIDWREAPKMPKAGER
jgi:hypothetical protein